MQLKLWVRVKRSACATPAWKGYRRREACVQRLHPKGAYSPRRAIAGSFAHQRELCPHHIDLCVVCLGHGERRSDSGRQQETQRQRRLQYARRRHAGHHHDTASIRLDSSRMMMLKMWDAKLNVERLRCLLLFRNER